MWRDETIDKRLTEETIKVVMHADDTVHQLSAGSILVSTISINVGPSAQVRYTRGGGS